MKRSPPILACLVLISLVGCGKPAAAPEPAPAPAAAAPAPAAPAACPAEPGLCLNVQPEAAALVVDETAHGTVVSLGAPGARFLALQPGIHLISLSLEGFETWRAEVSVAEGPETIEVELQAVEAPAPE